MKRCSLWLNCALLLIFWFSLLAGSRALSFAMDEPLHIAAGYALLARGKTAFWVFPKHGHPPLFNLLESVLVYLEKPFIPVETFSGWGENFVEYTASFLPYIQPMERAEILSRVPVMLMSLLLVALVYRWTVRLTRAPLAGFLAVIVLTFDPLLRAHSRFATTDLGVTLMALVAAYATWQWFQVPSWSRAVVLGLCLGSALVTKFSSILYIASSGVTILWKLITTRRWEHGAQGAISFIVALLVPWAFYGWETGRVANFPLPVPAPLYWQTLLDVYRSAGGRIFIAFGELRFGSHWWYFPLNFLIKNPIPWLIAVAWGGLSLLKAKVRWQTWIPVAVYPAIYGTAAMVQGMNVSYRHFLPVHPFLAMLAAYGVWQAVREKARYLLAMWSLLGLWYIGETFWIFPDELAYFNQLVGGPSGAPRYLVDYTQDWGQSMKQLRAYLDAHPGPEPYVVYYTCYLRPEYYGIRYRSLSPSPGATHRVTPFYPQPGRYAIGIATLYGLVGRDRMELEWFRRATPWAMVGHAYYVYEVNDQPRWLFQCSTPLPPLDAQAISRGFASSNLRAGTFDCTHGWLYPDGGNRLGVYALHGHLLRQPKEFLPPSLRPEPMPSDLFIVRHLSDARLSYWQSFFGLLPAFALYEREAGLLPQIPTGGLGIGSAENPLSATRVTDRSVRLSGPLAFLGAGVYRDGGGLDVETWWQVIGGPIARPFSIMGHLLTPGGAVLGVSDGLAVSPVELLPGDILVQRHRFDGVTGEEFLLRTGAYWLDTMERWSVAGEPGADAIFIQIRANPLPSEAR
jgi:4-amino-4-deoxy-L-arabinose transferase-like glycosyltransferase